MSNVPSIPGGSGADTITLASALTNSITLDLGGGSDKLTLAAVGNTGSVSNVETLVGGTGNDTITLKTATVNGSVDLGSGTGDTLQLANFTNRVSVANTETVFGGSGDDTVVLTGSNASMVIGGAGMNFITGDTGADEYVLDQNSAGKSSTAMNFSSAKGDKIALDTNGSSILTTNAYDLGGAALNGSTNLQAAADAATRMTVTEATGGKGGFIYQQNTGELYYKADGNFTAGGGGTMVGIIDSASNTPWVYDATKFIEV